jgi:hypothetical protein
MPLSKPDAKVASPRPVGPAHVGRAARGVVAGPHHDGVLGDAGLLDGVEDLAGVVVQLGQRVGVVASAGRAGEVLHRFDRGPGLLGGSRPVRVHGKRGLHGLSPWRCRCSADIPVRIDKLTAAYRTAGAKASKRDRVIWLPRDMRDLEVA